MPPFVCVVTGPVVGLRSTDLLEQSVDFAEGLRKKVVRFDLLDEVLREAGLDYANRYERIVRIGELFDGYQYQFELMRQNALCSIARQIDRLPQRTSAIVRMLASVEWRGVNVQFKDHRTLAETIKPDRIVTLIDAEWKIWEQFQKDYAKAVLRLVVQQGAPGIGTILRWLGSEVSTSQDWAEWCRHLTRKPVRHYVLAVQTPTFDDREKFDFDVDNLVKATTERTLPSFYASYSMTVSTEQERKEINDAIRRLRAYGLVIDPGSIEIGDEVKPEDEGVVFAFTVARDLRWDVANVDTVAAFHPYKERPPLSTGMMDELGHARAFRKERYFVLPTGGKSPFTGGTYVPKNHLFTDVDSLFAFLEKRRRPPLKPRFTEQVEAFAKWQRSHRDD